MDRILELKNINHWLVKIEAATKKIAKDKSEQVALYDKWTRQVNDTVKEYIKTKKEPDIKYWENKLQLNLFTCYKKLLNKD